MCSPVSRVLRDALRCNAPQDEGGVLKLLAMTRLKIDRPLRYIKITLVTARRVSAVAIHG